MFITKSSHEVAVLACSERGGLLRQRGSQSRSLYSRGNAEIMQCVAFNSECCCYINDNVIQIYTERHTDICLSAHKGK